MEQKRELLIFDDSYKHHVYHHGSTERILLLFDIWHPQISEEEKQHIIDMFDQAKAGVVEVKLRTSLQYLVHTNNGKK